MKQIEIDGEKLFALNETEFHEYMNTKPFKFKLAGNPIEIYIPLPNLTCMNWEYECNIPKNVGIKYENKFITLEQLKLILKVLKNEISPLLNYELKLGNRIIFEHDIRPIVEEIETQLKSNEIKRNTKIIIK